MKARMTPEFGLQQLRAAGGQRYVSLLQQGTLEVEYYQPVGQDPQKPHTRNEIYVIISGTGWFFDGKERRRFSPGEVIFMPAGTEHRFEDFSEDFATWGIFYGPQGGEGVE